MIPIYAALIAGLIALASASYTVISKQRSDVLRERQLVYAAIIGKKHLRNQLFVSRFEALIFSDYHERRWVMAGAPAGSLDLQEAQRWMKKSEDLAIEIAKINQSFIESVGLAHSSYAKSEKLDALVYRLYKFKTPLISKPPQNLGELEDWKAEAVRQLQRLVESEYGAPTDELLAYLEENMRKKL